MHAPAAVMVPLTPSPTAPEPLADDVATARARLNPWRLAATVLIAAVALGIVFFVVTNPRFEWPVVWRYLFAPSILAGLGMTLTLTALAMVIGTVIGTVAAIALLSDFRPGIWAARAYLWAFRGTPLLIQLIFWYNLAYLLPKVSIAIPFGPTLASWPTNELISPFLAALLGLGLAEGAYMTEIVRAGLLSVDPRQRDAARALGMRPSQAFFLIVLPQALRVIIPPSGNQVISLAKATALVSVIAMNDLLHAVQMIYNRTYEIVPLLMVAVIWYLVVITAMYAVQSRLEARFSRGQQRGAPAAGPAAITGAAA